MKYRYIMSGMFDGTDGEEYEINIPSPFLRNSEEEALQDEAFGYRFIWDDEIKEPVIAIFEGENFEVNEKNENRCLKVWVEGNIIKTYSFSEFKENGGYLRMLKPEFKGSGWIDGNTDFLDTDKTFIDIFPNMKTTKLYYIDSEAYYIEKSQS